MGDVEKRGERTVENVGNGQRGRKKRDLLWDHLKFCFTQDPKNYILNFNKSAKSKFSLETWSL